MRTAAEFKRLALNALKGKWVIAILVGLIASLLGADLSEGKGFKLNFDFSNSDINVTFSGQKVISIAEGWTPAVGMLVVGAFYIMLALLVLIILLFVLGSFIQVGYAKFNMELLIGKTPSFEILFSFWSYWKTTALTRFLRAIYTFLWTLLLIVPGIMAGYSYAMTDYILAENPNLSAGEAIALSKEMMTGNRWRLFCLELSFIGWDILCAFTVGIGNLWLRPYKQAAMAAFYREVSGLEYAEYSEL